MKLPMTSTSTQNVNRISRRKRNLRFAILLAHIEGLLTSRSLRNLQSSLEEETLLSSMDDDERTFVNSSGDDGPSKCPIEILMLIFYGGEIVQPLTRASHALSL